MPRCERLRLRQLCEDRIRRHQRRACFGGDGGLIFSETEGTKLERLQNYGAVEADTHGNSANGAGAAIHMAGICGFATGNATNKICNDIAYCDNYGNITSNSARSSGIVAAAIPSRGSTPA